MKVFRTLSLTSCCLILLGAGVPSLRADEVLRAADRLVKQHLTYIYGSEDSHNGGIDCSGFVQIVFRNACEVDLPNEADKQLDYVREHGQVWDSTSGWTLETLQPGDLIFYAGPDQLPRSSLIEHVMIYCGHDIMVGSQSRGHRIDGRGTGVGYYHFSPRVPRGTFGESGARFLGNRQVFAYGRLNPEPSNQGLMALFSTPAPAPLGNTSPASAAASARPSFNLKPIGINPRFD